MPALKRSIPIWAAAKFTAAFLEQHANLQEANFYLESTVCGIAGLIHKGKSSNVGGQK